MTRGAVASKQRARLCCRLHTGPCLSRPASLSFLAAQHNGAVLHILTRDRVLRRVRESTTRDPCAQRSGPPSTLRLRPSIVTAAHLDACALENPIQSPRAPRPGSDCGRRRYIRMLIRAFRVDPDYRTTDRANVQAVAGQPASGSGVTPGAVRPRRCGCLASGRNTPSHCVPPL